MVISNEELAVARKMRNDLIYFAEKNLVIKPKSGPLLPLKFNRAQLYFHQRCEEQRKKTGKVRQIVVKGRQQGISTYVNARFYHKTVWNEATLTFIFAHEAKSSSNLFDMVKRFYDNSDASLRPLCSKSNAYELLFPNIESGYKVGTAGSGAGIGRARTYQNLHWSEVAYCDKSSDLAAGVLATVADLLGTEIVLESTANGQGDYFHEVAMKAHEGSFEDWQLTFLPWYWQDEYKREVSEGFALDDYETFVFECFKHDGLTLEHIAWRRAKLKSPDFNGDERKFKKEYPFTLEEAFEASDDESYIRAVEVAESLKTPAIPHNSALVWGVDPATVGKDDFGLVERAGRTVTHADILPKFKDNDESCDWLARRINERKPLLVNIDTIGVGIAIYDGLKRRGFEKILRKINVAERASRPELYHNKRAELHARAKAWINDRPSSIAIQNPAIKKQLAQELTYARAKYDSNNALQIEKNDDIKKRHKVSPGLASAFFLTFASEIPVDDMHRVVAQGTVIQMNAAFDPFA